MVRHRASRHGPIWSELERDAHRFVLDMLRRGAAADDAERIADRILLARTDLTVSMRQEYTEALAARIRTYAELLGCPLSR